MENEISNLVSISKNKYNINLLETIEYKELFNNVNNNPKQLEYKKYDEIFNNEIIQNTKNKKINFTQDNLNKKISNNSKNSAKSLKDNMKCKIYNLKDIFNKYSPEKNIRSLTQYNSGKINENKKIKRKFANSLNKRINNNKALLQNNLSDFKNQNKNFSLISKKKEYIPQSRNDGSKVNKIIKFTNNPEKEIENNNNLKYSFNTYNNHNLTNNTNNINNLDVYNRLYNKSYYKKKNNIISTEDKDCTFNPKLLTQFKEKTEINDFIKRQENFNKYIKQKKIDLKKDINLNESKKCTFTPNTTCTSGSKYSIKLEAQRQDESKQDKTNRMAYDQIKKMEIKNYNLFTMYNNKYSFIPLINKKRNIKNIKKYELKNVPKFKKRIIITHKNENKSQNNHKYINHQYDNVKSIYKNDKELMRRIKEENIKKTKRVDLMRKEQENDNFERYTFKPDINRNNLNNVYNCNQIFYNRNLESEISYSNNYNKKLILQNKIKRSHSCYNKNNKNNLYTNNCFNYNNLNNPHYYNNTEYENDIHYYNNYNNTEDNCYNYNNNYFIENDINQNYLNNNHDYILYNNYASEYNKYENQNNDIRERSFTMGCNKHNFTYEYINPIKNSIYKSRALKNIKKEDEENFLLIHKLLYNK